MATTFETQVRTIVASLEVELKDSGLLSDEYSLRYQIGSPTYGNSFWVALTGGDLETGIHIIDVLHMAPNTKRDTWLNAVKAYRRMNNMHRRQQRMIADQINCPARPYEF